MNELAVARIAPEKGSAVGPRFRMVSAGVLAALFFAIPPMREVLALPGWAYSLPMLLLVLLAVYTHSMSLRLHVPGPVGVYLSFCCLLFAWLMVTALWTRSPEQYRTDLMLVLGLTGISVVVASVLSLRAVDAFTVAACVIGGLVSLYVMSTYQVSAALRAYAFQLEEFYLVTATPIGVAAVGSSLRAFTDARHRRWWAALALVSLAGLALSLARGALLSAVFIIVVTGILLLLIRRGDRSSFTALVRSSLGRMAGALVILGASATTFYLALQVERTANRMTRFFSGSELQAGGRGALWETAMESIAAAPFLGYGLGSNGLMSGTSDSLYPHNMILQVWLDGGVIGLVLLLAVLTLPFFIMLRDWRWDAAWQRRCVPLVGMYLFLALEFAKSSNFYGARILFLTGIMAVWALSARKHRVHRTLQVHET